MHICWFAPFGLLTMKTKLFFSQPTQFFQPAAKPLEMHGNLFREMERKGKTEENLWLNMFVSSPYFVVIVIACRNFMSRNSLINKIGQVKITIGPMAHRQG